MADNTERLSSALADRYKIERHLGEGGLANVYLAEDLKHKRKVALNVLKPDLAAVLGAERLRDADRQPAARRRVGAADHHENRDGEGAAGDRAP